MIKHAETVVLQTVGGYRCRVTVESSVMSSEKLKSILLKYGGEDKDDYCYFSDIKPYLEVKKQLSEEGASVTSFNQ